MKLGRRDSLFLLALSLAVGLLVVALWKPEWTSTGEDAGGANLGPAAVSELAAARAALRSSAEAQRSGAPTPAAATGRPPAAQLSVADAIDGRPISGAAIGTGVWTGERGRAERLTDAAGQAPLPAGSPIWVAAEGYVPQLLERADLASQANAHGRAPVRLNPVGQLQVEVVDRVGNPIPGVAVEVRTRGYPGQARAVEKAFPWWLTAPPKRAPPPPGLVPPEGHNAPEPQPAWQVAVTDGFGVFRWDQAPVGLEIVVSVRGQVPHQSRSALLSEETRRAEVRFVAEVYGTITGRFVREGRGLENTVAELYDGLGECKFAYADRSGVFRFEGVRRGWVQLRTLSAVGWRRELEVTGDHYLGEIELPPLVLRQGRLVSADPIATNALSVIAILDGRQTWVGSVGPKGDFYVEGPPGPLELCVLSYTTPPARFPVLDRVVEFPFDNLELPIDAHLARLELRWPADLGLPPGSEVQVDLSSGQSGLPHVRGLESSLQRRTNRAPLTADGVAVLPHLAPGEYEAWVRAPQGAALYLPEVRLRAGETTAIECAPPPPTSLDVRWIGPLPEADGLSVLFHRVEAAALMARPGSDGRVRFEGLSPGPGGLELLAADGRPLADREIELAPGDNQALLDVGALAGLSGRVLGLERDHSARLVLMRWTSPTLPVSRRSVHADPEGDFDFGALPPGRYRLLLVVSAPEPSTGTTIQTFELLLAEGTAQRLELVAPSAHTLEIEFRLRGEPLQDLASVEALARGPLGELIKADGRALGGGRFEVQRLPAPVVYLLAPGRDPQSLNGFFIELPHRYVAVDRAPGEADTQRSIEVAGLPVRLASARSPLEWPQIQPLEVAGVDLTLGVTGFTLAPLESGPSGADLAPLPPGSVLLVHDPKAPPGERVRRWTPSGPVEIRAD